MSIAQSWEKLNLCDGIRSRRYIVLNANLLPDIGWMVAKAVQTDCRICRWIRVKTMLVSVVYVKADVYEYSVQKRTFSKLRRHPSCLLRIKCSRMNVTVQLEGCGTYRRQCDIWHHKENECYYLSTGHHVNEKKTVKVSRTRFWKCS